MSNENGKRKISTEPYKGVRDFYPEDQIVERYILERMRAAAEAFGYQEYNASPLEPSELYLGKTSEEIVREQTYTFSDRGGRSVTLRPEMTPTVARLVAARRKSLSFPLRLFSIPNIFRYERPQRGRLREHYQLNADIFGVSGYEAELETLSLAHFLLRSFGLSDDQFEIRLNDRNALDGALSESGISKEKRIEVFRLLDRKSKIKTFEEDMRTLLGGKTVDFENIGSEAITNLIKELGELGIRNVVHDKTLARGFDYYTGIVFEIFDTNPENSRSMFGGGRYDNLLEMFGEEPVPAVGFGMGDVVVRDVLETYDLLPSDATFADAYVCIVNSAQKIYGHAVAQRVREDGWRAAVDMRYDSLGNQIKRALQLGAEWAFIIGEDEVKKSTVTLKHLSTETQQSVTVEEALARMVKE